MALHKDVRRQRAFEEFKRRLDGMGPDQIRALLEERRIRSPERIELAEARLKQHEKAASATSRAATGAAARRGNGNGRDQSRAAKTSEEAAAGGAATARGREEVPMARQVGRMLGIGLGVVSLAALAVFAIRR